MLGEHMPILQVRDLPQELYDRLAYLADKDRRSLAQEAIAVLEEGIDARLGDTERRRVLLERDDPLGLCGTVLRDPVELVREDRQR